jgi:hypothetical protein
MQESAEAFVVRNQDYHTSDPGIAMKALEEVQFFESDLEDAGDAIQREYEAAQFALAVLLGVDLSEKHHSEAVDHPLVRHCKQLFDAVSTLRELYPDLEELDIGDEIRRLKAYVEQLVTARNLHESRAKKARERVRVARGHALARVNNVSRALELLPIESVEWSGLPCHWKCEITRPVSDYGLACEGQLEPEPGMDEAALDRLRELNERNMNAELLVLQIRTYLDDETSERNMLTEKKRQAQRIAEDDRLMSQLKEVLV